MSGRREGGCACGAVRYRQSRLPWLVLPESVPSFEAHHDTKAVWPTASLERLATITAAPGAGA